MNRRRFLTTTAASLIAARMNALCPTADRVQLGIITDEVSPDLEKALEFCKQFDFKRVELRNVWGKYITEFQPDEVKRAQNLLAKYSIRVSVVDTEYFKIQLPGTTSTHTPKREAPDIYQKQDALLERAIGRARDFGTDKLRIFAFWRVEDPKTVFERVRKDLEKSAEIARKEKIRLVPENEHACNVATARESVAALNAVRSAGLGLNWDPGNAYAGGEHDTFPEGYAMLDKKRIWHMHVKDCDQDAAGKYRWLPAGAGKIDYVKQFAALRADGYRGSISIETHFRLPDDQGGKLAASAQAAKGLIDAFCKG